MTGHRHLNRNERLLAEVIDAAVNHRLLQRVPQPFSLAIQNEALAFFVSNARYIPEISPGYLIKIAEAIRADQAWWEAIIRAEFRR